MPQQRFQRFDSNNRSSHEAKWSTYVQKIKTTSKSVDSGQPARTAQADLGRYFFANLLNPLFTNSVTEISLVIKINLLEMFTSPISSLKSYRSLILPQV